MKEWKTVLVATDFSSAARHAVDSALAIAGTGARLHLLHVVQPPAAGYRVLWTGAGTADLETVWREGAEAEMERELARLRPRRPQVAGHVRVGKPWPEILEAARELRADLVCLGASGHSRVERLVLGSTAENVVRHARVPVLVTRGRPLRRIRRVLLPVDFDEGSRAAARFVRERLPVGTRIEALHVVPPPLPLDLQRVAYLANTPEGVDEDVRAFLGDAGLRDVVVRTKLFGDPAAEILSAARDADLVVLSTQGRTGVARVLLGSVAEKVVRHAPCPVLVLPAGPKAGASASRRKRAQRQPRSAARPRGGAARGGRR